MAMISPSLLAADFGDLRREAENATRAGADMLHIDVMDGQFVPNISFGPQMLRMIAKSGIDIPLDVHLMIAQPERYLHEYAEAAYITVHAEACPHLHRVLQQIRELGCKAGVALNPHTPVTVLDYLLPELDLVLIMSVNPGFGGQKFLPLALDKVRRLREISAVVRPELLIEVDGGVTAENAPALIEAGADVLVAGTAVFGKADYAAAIAAIRGG